jgi:hypothetical protein
MSRVYLGGSTDLTTGDSFSLGCDQYAESPSSSVAHAASAMGVAGSLMYVPVENSFKGARRRLAASRNAVVKSFAVSC